MLPYFKRSEDNERGEDAFHGVGGPLSVSESRSMHAARRHDARGRAPGRARAQPRLQRRAPGGRRALPADPARRHALEHGRRLPAARARAAESRRDHPRAGARGSCSRASARSGVEVARDGRVEEIRAEREVILSAGAYQSPVLLMLSGIGPEDQLAPLAIEMRDPTSRSATGSRTTAWPSSTT